MYKIFVFLALSIGYLNVVSGQDPEEPVRAMVTTPRGYWRPTTLKGFTPLTTPRGYTPLTRPQGYWKAEPPSGYRKDEPPSGYWKAEPPRGSGPQSTNSDMSANQVKRPPGQRPPPTRRMTPRSAMIAYCSMSESDPAVDGNQMKERLMAYISCKESTMLPSLSTCYVRNAKSSWPSSDEQKWSYYCDKSNRRLVRKVERCVRKSVPNRIAYNKKARMCLDTLNAPTITPVDEGIPSPGDGTNSGGGQSDDGINGSQSPDDGSINNDPTISDGGQTALLERGGKQTKLTDDFDGNDE